MDNAGARVMTGVTSAWRAGLLAVLCALAAGCTPEFDLILEGGSVIDGTGAPAFEADVGILDGPHHRSR